jgi:hypothetical protein
MKIDRRDLKENPRIELIPSFMNLPLILVLILLPLVIPDIGSIINREAANIFGFDVNYLSIIIGFSSLALIILAYLIIQTIFRRTKVPIFLHLVNGFLFLLYEAILIFVIRTNDYLTINYIYQNLGYGPSLLVFLTLASILLICIIRLVNGIPKLWQYQVEPASNFHPKKLAIITLINFGLAFSLLLLFLIGHHSMIFWQIVFYSTDWNALLTIFHGMLIILFGIVVLTQKKFGSNAKKGGTYFHLIEIGILACSFIVITFLSQTPSAFTIYLYPFSIITYIETFYFVFTHILSPAIKINTKFDRRIKLSAIRVPALNFTFFWLFLFQPLISLPPEPILPVVDLNVVRNSYSNLTATQKTLFDNYLNSRIYPGISIEDVISSEGERGLTRLAGALLFRNGTGDIENATILLNHIINNGSNYGNFVGCDLILIIEKHQNKLDPDLVARIKMRLLLHAETLFKENARPTHTNWALMTAFILQWVGYNLDQPKYRVAGIQKAWSVFLLFQRNGTFSEFNSPTYGGVDMLSITLWREFGPTETMRRMGALMEDGFWKELSAFYHPGFKNLVGPYFRKYGMDMKGYTAIIGIWIALAINDLEKAPLPATMDFENNNILPAVQVGHSIPNPTILNNFIEFSGSRFLQRKVPSDISNIGKEYYVTAILQPKWMAGGVTGKIYQGTQFATGTLMWNATDGSYSWILISGQDKLDVVVNNDGMQITQTRTSDEIVLYLKCNISVLGEITGTKWILPGMNITISVDPATISTSIINSEEFKKDYQLREDVPDIVKIVCSERQLNLKIEI